MVDRDKNWFEEDMATDVVAESKLIVKQTDRKYFCEPKKERAPD